MRRTSGFDPRSMTRQRWVCLALVRRCILWLLHMGMMRLPAIMARQHHLDTWRFQPCRSALVVIQTETRFWRSQTFLIAQRWPRPRPAFSCFLVPAGHQVVDEGEVIIGRRRRIRRARFPKTWIASFNSTRDRPVRDSTNQRRAPLVPAPPYSASSRIAPRPARSTVPQRPAVAAPGRIHEALLTPSTSLCRPDAACSVSPTPNCITAPLEMVHARLSRVRIIRVRKLWFGRSPVHRNVRGLQRSGSSSILRKDNATIDEHWPYAKRSSEKRSGSSYRACRTGVLHRPTPRRRACLRKPSRR